MRRFDAAIGRPSPLRRLLESSVCVNDSGVANVKPRTRNFAGPKHAAGQRAAELMSAAPFATVVVLKQRIRWFDMGERRNAAQHHHAWVVFDHAHPQGYPPALLYA